MKMSSEYKFYIENNSFYILKQYKYQEQNKIRRNNMKILNKNLRYGEVTIQVTSEEDLWYLSHTLEELDQIKGRTERKIKIGEGENAKTVRKPVFLELILEKIEYEPENSSLRLLGKIISGPEDVSNGSYHSFNLEQTDIITIKKEYWTRLQLQKLEEATEEKPTALIVMFDRENAIFSTLKKTGYQKISEIKGDVQKKADPSIKKSEFYKEISKQIQEYTKKHEIKKIILASPAFWKEYLVKELPEELKKIAILATISDVSETSLSELVKSPQLTKSLEHDRTAQEIAELDKVLEGIRKEKAFYGWTDSKEKIESGAAETVIVSETFLKTKKMSGQYNQVDSILSLAESTGAKICILTQKETCQKIDSLGGIAGTTRWIIK